MGGGGGGKGQGQSVGGGGKGGGDKGLFDWILNPVGSAVGSFTDIEIDPFSSAAANIATNAWDSALGRELERPWAGEVMGPMFGEQGQQAIADQADAPSMSEKRQEDHERFMARYAPAESDTGSLLTDGEEL